MSCFRSLIALLLVCCSALTMQAQSLLDTSPMRPPDVHVQGPTEGIVFDAAGIATARFVVRIPPDHHGYLDQGDEGLLIPLHFSFEALAEQGIQVTEIARPQGRHDEQAQATVLRGSGDFVFRLVAHSTSLPTDTDLMGTLRHQICDDITNICYPPRTIEFPLRFRTAAATQPGTETAMTSQPDPIAALTLRERIDRLFQQYTQNLFLAFALVFVAGLFAAATPCVYPIIPITSAILMARGGASKRQGRLHAFVYFIGMIFFYTLLGALAATTGTALSAIMTSAWVNLGFALVFAYLGLSMLGLYEFQFLSALTAKLDTASSRRRGVTGTFFMGTTAGLVVSPCIGPVVGAILLGITGQAATVSVEGASLPVYTVIRGIVLMAAFGAGLGLPFLVVGLLSHRLPQSGTWLTKINFLLGLLILYFAYTYYVKSMETLGVSPNATYAMLVGIVAIILAVFMGAFHTFGDRPQTSLMLRRACGIILLIIGSYFLYNGLGRSGILIGLPPDLMSDTQAAGQETLGQSPTPRYAQPELEQHGNLVWWRDVALARQRAMDEHKPLFVDFYATWCANCKAFNRLALQNNALNAALQEAVLMKVYDTDEAFRTFQQDRRFPELQGIGGQPFLPLFAIYSSQGEFIWKGQDYQAIQTMISQLEHARHVSMQ